MEMISQLNCDDLADVLTNMDVNVHDEQVQIWGIRVIACSDQIDVTEKLRLGAHVRMIVAMNCHVQNPRLQEEAFDAVWTLAAGNEPVQDLFTDIGVYNCVIRAIHNHPHDVEMHIQAFDAVISLIDNESRRNTYSLLIGEVHKVIIQAMIRLSNEARVQERGCVALSYLCVDKDTQDEMKDCAQVVCTAMTNHIDDSLVLWSACMLIDCLTTNNKYMQDAFRNMGAQTLVSHALLTHKDDEDVRVYAERALKNLQ